MTKLQILQNSFIGLIMILIGAGMLYKPQSWLGFAVRLLSVMLIVGGLRYLVYYIDIARSMVGGRSVLYRGILMLDAGALTLSMTSRSMFYLILYLAGAHMFAGVVELMRALEQRRVGSPAWRFRAAVGSANVALAVAVVAGGFAFHSETIVVYVYGAGLIYSGLLRIISAFRKTAIVYIR